LRGFCTLWVRKSSPHPEHSGPHPVSPQVLYLCSDVDQADAILSLAQAYPNTYAMVGSPVITHDLHRAGLSTARRFVCFADDELQVPNHAIRSAN